MKERFYEIVKYIKREGIDDLTAWLESTDFFVAPASTVYHQNYEGGLLEHSLNVYDNLVKLCEFYNVEYTQEEIAIVALFHDLCKINTFEKTPRGYKIKEQYAFGGHGSKSVYLTMKRLQDRIVNESMNGRKEPRGIWFDILRQLTIFVVRHSTCKTVF